MVRRKTSDVPLHTGESRDSGFALSRAPESRYLKSRRDAMRGDDLIGGPAGDLGHAVELPGETAGTRRRRSQLHDQFADLGFRHHGADAIPAGPALAGIEDENLTSPPREDGVDLRGGVGGTDDLHQINRLPQLRLAL